MKKTILALVFGLLTMFAMATEPPQTSPPPQSETQASQAEVQATPAQDSTIVIDPPPGGTPTVNWLFSQANVIYMGLLYLLTFLSGYLPFLKKLDDKRLRALIIGLILAGGFVVWQLFQKDLNWMDFAGLAFAFVSTQLGYQFILSPIPALKTPEPEKKK
jgi:hypothetical protein